MEAKDPRQRPCLFAETFLHISSAIKKPPTPTFSWLHCLLLLAIHHACIVIISAKNRRRMLAISENVGSLKRFFYYVYYLRQVRLFVDKVNNKKRFLANAIHYGMTNLSISRFVIGNSRMKIYSVKFLFLFNNSSNGSFNLILQFLFLFKSIL